MTRDELMEYFLNIPVSINNLYGDPFFKDQEENTFSKLYSLHKSGHKGVVSIITKTEINERIALRLGYYAKRLKLIILLSVSELPTKIEGVPGDRYNTISKCLKYGIPILPYIRPFIPGENTSSEILDKLFRRIQEEFKDKDYSVIVSGLRGNEEILNKFSLTQEYNLRVKIIPTHIKEYLQSMTTTIFQEHRAELLILLG